MNDNALEQFRNMIVAFIIRDDYNDEVKIDELIKQLANMPIFENKLSEDEIREVRNQIHSECLIKLDSGVGIISRTHVKWFKNMKSSLNMKYWDRYKQYLSQDKKFPIPVVNKMDDVSDELTDLLGDPTIQENFQRRGLIIGDVQSGKTANYTGLICKAADAGYKVIVLLTGTIEKLRKQTQMRLDEGFIGMDSSAMIKQKENVYVGVGNYDKSLHPMVLTSKSDDFNARVANNLGFTLNSLSEPVLFVIKKNVSVLKRLNNWLKLFNLNGNTCINTSLLMIDDESDNASINTNPEDRDPTATNSQIVNMLKIFKKASYVGFTATPFANIFIDPNTNEEMEKENLFPKDYIYSLDAPSNYIGARNIFGENANYSSMIKEITDGENFYPMSHKKDFVIDAMAPSLVQAVNEFLIANVIRDLRGDRNAHRSMIVNASRFVDVQAQFGQIVNNYLKNVQASARLYGKIDQLSALKDNNLKSLYDTYRNDYSNVEFMWEEIQNMLSSSIEPIQVIVVNERNYGNLNYEENEELGLRTIVIGGMSLSRGLTLEGLIISYFYRNSKMYDTLMQMGRWFGYRKNYDDLCRIWLNEDNVNWYQHISDSTDELRRDVKRMRDQGATPLEFGLRVRNDIDTLLVTARNKMRTASRINKLISLSGEYVETPKLFNDKIKNSNNHKAIKHLIDSIKCQNIACNKEEVSTGYGYKAVDKRIIIEFLENFEVSYANVNFDTKAITEFIKNYAGNELNEWDVVFITGSSPFKYEIEPSVSINRVIRHFALINGDKLIQMSGHRSRLGSTADSKFGLSKKQVDLLNKKFEEENEEGKSINQKYYFSESVKRNPLLMIYAIDLNNVDREEFKDKLNSDFVEEPLVGISIGIPWLSDEKTKYAHYQINLIALQTLEEYELEGGEEQYD